MDRNFEKLAFWDDPVSRDGPRQMACDEALIHAAQLPILRIFRWQGCWVSAGYFADRDKTVRAHPELPFCRRWTGGGVVVHERDFTFALIVPRGEKLSGRPAGESYRQIHLALAKALRTHGIEADLSAAATAMGECFAGPVEHDLVLDGTKIAGGAQRRTRKGLLHQGSVQGLPGLGRGFGKTLAHTLSSSVEEWAAPRNFDEQVETLAKDKYACADFLQGPRRANNLAAVATS